MKIAVDLPVMDYSSVENLLKPDKTWFPLYSGRLRSKHHAGVELSTQECG